MSRIRTANDLIEHADERMIAIIRQTLSLVDDDEPVLISILVGLIARHLGRMSRQLLDIEEDEDTTPEQIITVALVLAAHMSEDGADVFLKKLDQPTIHRHAKVLHGKLRLAAKLHR